MKHKIVLLRKEDASRYYRGQVVRIPHGTPMLVPRPLLHKEGLTVTHIDCVIGTITVKPFRRIDWRRTILLAIWGALWAAVLLMLCLGDGRP